MLLMLFVVVALAIAYYLLVGKQARLEAENLKLKRDFGVLEVTDPNLVHSIGFFSDMGSTYRFRFYIPADKRFVLRYVFGPVPKTGFDVQLTENHVHGQYELRSEVFNEPNHEVSLQFQKDLVVMSYPNDTRKIPYTPASQKAVSGQIMGGLKSEGQTEKAQPGQRLELMRQHSRFTPRDPVTKKYTTDIYDGILLWIEEVPASVTEQRKKDDEIEKAILRNTHENSKKS